MTTYAYKGRFEALPESTDNAPTLESWDVDTSDPTAYHDGLTVVRDVDTHQIVAIVDDATFDSAFEVVPD